MHTPEAISFLAISLASSGAWEISAGASEAYILHMLNFSSQTQAQLLHLTTPLHHNRELHHYTIFVSQGESCSLEEFTNIQSNLSTMVTLWTEKSDHCKKDDCYGEARV